MATSAAIAAALVGSPAFAQDKLEAGRTLFNKTAVPACAVCHALKNAGAEGAIGPSLDELKPDATRVEKAVRNGIGQMPAFKNLTDEQIKLLGQYVATVTAAGK
ncbi:SorU family sulfite dehydrogenase c-type cytochrome subunit [Massilia soli]|uniref:Cytochrome c n=2 Tax=Massilia TaxID=149698 RepID=A0ABS7SL99_9BURK|nr:cytochrome c [Massilia soli]MBZ2206596.1 cytochrome c [Massilia soli]